MQRSAPNWPRFLWHYRVHRDWVGEQLFFFRLRFDPVYDRDAAAAGVRDACAAHGVRAVISYEMFGGYDVVLRIWLPQATTPKDFHESLARELAPAGVTLIEPFAVEYAVRHFLFTGEDGKPLIPQDDALHHLQASEIEAIETGFPDDVDPELLERLTRENLLAQFWAVDQDDSPEHPGVKFAIVVSGAPDLSRPELIAFEREIVRVLDAATEIAQQSLYAGFGFGHFLIMGRVAYDAYHAVHSDLITQLNTAALRKPFEVRTETHLSGQRGYHIAEEGLSGIPVSRAADLRIPERAPRLLPQRVIEAANGELRPDDVFAERFEIKARLGAGGYATVYRAWDTFERVDRALKVFRAADQDVVLREISALRKVAHPNVVKPVWAGLEGDSWFLVTEFIQGRSLRDIEPEELGDVRALEILDQVLAALQAVHPKDDRIAELTEEGRQHDLTPDEFEELQQLKAEGLIHRDIKPENIMVGDDNVVRLVDFNIASPARDPKRTRTGTKGYQAPDAGEDRWEPADDLFACGVVLYELLTGELPYTRDDGKESATPIDIRERRRDLPLELARIVMCACSPSRAERYDTAKKMRAELQRQLRVLRTGTGADRIGRAFRDERRRLGLSTQQLASKTGVSAKDIEAFEEAKAEPMFTEAMRLAQELELDLHRLFDDVREEPADGATELRRFRRVVRAVLGLADE